MSPLGESSSLTSERVSAASDIINNEFLVVHGASQPLDEHPWCSQSDTSPVLFLPRPVGQLLNDDGVAYRHDRMDHLSMQALAMSRQLAFCGSLPASHLLVGLAAFPVQLLLAAS